MNNLSPPSHYASKLNLRVPKDEMKYLIDDGDDIVAI